MIRDVFYEVAGGGGGGVIGCHRQKAFCIFVENEGGWLRRIHTSFDRRRLYVCR